jgi:hypothetical protein
VNAPKLVWVVVIDEPSGDATPIAISSSLNSANNIAREAIEQVSLGLSYHASEAKKAEARRKFDSIDVRKAWLLMEEKKG